MPIERRGCQASDDVVEELVTARSRADGPIIIIRIQWAR